MSPDSENLDDTIYTNDLCYTSPNGRYSFRFSYLGDGVIAIKSAGYLDETSMKEQILAGSKARQRFQEAFPGKRTHLVWDMSEVNGASILSRHLVFRKVSSDGSIESVTLVGANLLVTSFVQIISKLIPNLKFFFFRTFDEGLFNLRNHFNKIVSHKPGNIFLTNDVSAYARFIELWQENPTYFFINNTKLKILSTEKWSYNSPDNSFKVFYSVIDGNIVYGQLEGSVKSSDIDKSYHILENIMQELAFNSTTNKFYTILHLKKIKGVSLSARKRTSFYENRFKNRSYMVMMVPPYFIQILLKVVKAINSENFSHWKFINSVEGAFSEILNQRQGLISAVSTETDPHETKDLTVPKSRSEMIQLIHDQHRELVELKKHQEEQIYKILEVTGRMTWDESFVAPHLIPDSEGPFNEVFNSLSILFQDFKEIINEKTFHAQKLKESEDKYKNLIDLASDIILVYQDNAIKFVNSRVIHVMGYLPEEVIGQGMERFVAIQELTRLQEYYRRRMNGEELPWVYETEFIHKDGHRVPMSMSVGRISYENQPAAMIISRDITHKKRTDEELEKYRNHLEEIVKQRTQQLQKEISDRKFAEESDRLKSAFLSNMSHEIRTPMNAIISFSNFLKDPNIPKTQHDEFLTYIQSSGQSLMRLINDIIDISKIEAKQLSIQASPTYIDSILDELYKFFEDTRNKLRKFDIGLILTIPDRERNTCIDTDPYRLKQILSNLLENAIKFTDKGTIEFGYHFDDQNVLFYVKDTGIGIPEDKTDQIFRRFGKLESSDRNLRGTGLGLAISKNLSYLLKGNLWLESKEGEGSIFYLSLPNTSIKNEQIFSSASVPIASGSTNWSTKKFLIVEDEDLNFKVLQIALKRTGVQIIRAVNGLDAIDKIKQIHDISLVLMDIQMPVMDGYESMQGIKKIRPNLPVIAQTAFALLEEQNKCIDMGFSDYLSKPIRIDELYAKIEKQLHTGN
jgi:PAS domain S-box-containing protein